MSHSACPYWVRVQAELLIRVWEEGHCIVCQHQHPQPDALLMHHKYQQSLHITEKNVAMTY